MKYIKKHPAKIRPNIRQLQKRSALKKKNEAQKLEDLKSIRVAVVCAKIAAWTFGIVATIIAVRDLTANLEGLEATRKSSAEQSITSAWQLLTAKSPGNSGKTDALETLDRAEINLVGLDLSCETQGGRDGLTCRYPVYLEELRLGSWKELADLREVNFRGATMNYARIAANLSGANLADSLLQGTSFSHSGGRAVDFSGTFGDVDFSRTFFIGSSFSNASLSDSNFSNAAFINSSFEGAFLLQADFSQSSLDLSDFSTAYIGLADFTGIEGKPNLADAVFGKDLPPIVDVNSDLRARLCPEEVINELLDGSMSSILEGFGVSNLADALAVQSAVHRAAAKFSGGPREVKAGSEVDNAEEELLRIVGFYGSGVDSFAYGGRLRTALPSDNVGGSEISLSIVRNDCELVRIADFSSTDR
ncbi:Pentapeptide repeat-containing protein [Salipiger thiooxidans]|uniref:Pentapeptide repeat-containing protein n=1 Tax=Salipiger thiooxidans TaxID=282683 RepID=A0A1G7JQG4_9RHOB|nr:pentapeptide repeat-containing protein [Salipiger thiooxidans]SDF27182.1 Pentapeptide repeat-containing protein [Salipiger thiooxidans]